MIAGTDNATVLDELVVALRQAAEFNSADQAAPAVILWPDPGEEWAPLLPELRARVPELFTLGPLETSARSGPAIWLRCVLARKLAGMDWPADRPPIFYLPGVGRKTLREIEDAPDVLAPLLELQFRGTAWFHANGKDWTVLAFAQCRLGMDVARDSATLAALRQALPEFARLRRVELDQRRWEAGNFNRLLAPDPSRDLLMWLDRGDEFKKSRASDEWDAFKQICQRDYSFHPDTDGALRAAALLGQRGGAWAQVWERFAESPTLYPNLPESLRAAKPKDESDLFFKPEVWPQFNEAAENKLGDALVLLQDRPYPEAAERIKALESAQGPRRTWVWRKLGRSDLAEASEHLAKLADFTQQLPTADSPDKLAAAYVAGGWQADAALLKALKSRRRVKEQQKRIGSAEFRSTQFSYRINEDGLEKFVSTPELQSEDSIGGDPLPPGQLWIISPGGQDEHAGLFRVDTTVGPGAGVRILNQPPPPPFKESVKCAEQNLYTRAKQLVGDRDPREHEFSIQLRAFDAAKSGSAVGVGVMIALCSALLQKGIKGGHVVVGGLNLGGSIDPVHNAVNVVELAVGKGATHIVIPISARRQLNDLPDELAIKINIQYYTDVREVLLKVLET